MTQALFFDPQLEFEKTAAETALSEDPNQWSDEVLQELYKQVPYLADFDLNVVMESVEGERGYGLGHVEVSNKSEAPMTSEPGQLQSAGIRTARIPVIVKDGKLQPFDVIVTDDARALPLTDSRLRQALFRPQNFDVTSKTPGDQSMIGQLYPPYRQNYGFGGGGVATSAGMSGKTAKVANLLEYLSAEHEKTAAMKLEGVKSTPVSALEAAAKKEKGSCGVPMKTAGSILAEVLSQANASDIASFKAAMTDPATKVAYGRNAAAYEAIELIANARPTSLEKQAAAIASNMRPSVLQVVKLADGYAIKTASHRMWAPTTEVVSRGELVHRCGPKVALAADMSGSATVSSEIGVGDEAPPPPAPAPALSAGPTSAAEQITAPGIYSVQAADGRMLTGSVITNLMDVDGKPLPIALFTDGKHAAVQSDISGTLCGEFVPPGTVPATAASGRGVFLSMAGGLPCATLPLELGASMQSPGEDELPKFQAETFDGRPVQVSVQPYVQSIQNVDGIMLVPHTWEWVSLDGAEDIALSERPEEVGKLASVSRALASVIVRGSGPDSFSLSGFPVEKLASAHRSFLSQDDALFLLVGLGANAEYAQHKLAAAATGREPVAVRIGRILKTAEEVRGETYTQAEKYLSAIPTFRHRLWKEAAVLPDPVAIDSVLSLGFINPENIATYVGYLPVLDEAQRRMCELLIGARLGLRELPGGSLERAIRALEDVIEGLKVIAFQG